MGWIEEITLAFQLSPTDWTLSLVCIFLIGTSKSGIKGTAIMVVAILALIFGAKSSTGILLPFLVAGDILAVIYYKRHVHWGYLLKLLPWMIAGVLIGVWVGHEMDEDAFKNIMAVIILLGVGFMFWWDRKKSEYIPDNHLFAGVMGLLAGFTTMIGNLAGAFTTLYFLSMRLPKKEFIGTIAWLFFLTNLFKVPFHILVWNTITITTLKFNILLLFAIVIGFAIGVKLLSYIREKLYRNLILVMTGIGALVLILK